MRDDYSDIINVNYQGSSRRKHMSMHDRAAQFAPFAALTGYDASIDEAARLTDSEAARSEQEMFMLNEKMHILSEHISEKPEAEFTCFVPDKRKSGGSYDVFKGNVRRIDEIQRLIILTDGTQISLDRIYKIESDIF
ncbi:MAG: hypothetical protein IJL63_08470 [Clostridia bacterium]|nr:hypothetical protein [Clostridia bacterium]